MPAEAKLVRSQQNAVYRSTVPNCTLATHWNKEPASGATDAIVVRFDSTCTSTPGFAGVPFQFVTLELYRLPSDAAETACSDAGDVWGIVMDDTEGCALGDFDAAPVDPVVRREGEGRGTVSLGFTHHVTPGMAFVVRYTITIDEGYVTSDGTAPCAAPRERFGPMYRCQVSQQILTNPA
jgi:hypothetical protein